MSNMKMGTVESSFADMIWDNEPVSTAELVKLGAEKLNWKRTTTYTVLKRLCERGIFQMEDSKVTSLISREDYYSTQSERFVNDTFNGSLPAFIAAFARKKKLTEQEISEIRKMIDEYDGE